MSKLNQVIALAKGKKSRSEAVMTQLYHKLQKGDLLKGIARTYAPKNENEETLPDEKKNIQFSCSEAIREASDVLVEMFNVVAAQDNTNCLAFADVVVDGKTLLTKVPVTSLLFIEKQLVDLHTFINKLPTLDSAYEWTWDANALCFRTQPQQLNRTKKVFKNHEMTKATDKHPAQVHLYTEEEVIGVWNKVDFSGAMPAQTQKEMLDRVRKLQEAVKIAREQANMTEVTDNKIGAPVLTYIFGSNGTI